MPEATKVVLLNADNTPVTAATPLPVVVEAGGGTAPAPNQGTWTDRSGTVTAGGVSQTLAAANSARKRLLIENPPSATENLTFNFTATAVGAAALVLVPGGAYDSEGGPVSTELVTVSAATTAHAFIAKEM